MKMPALIFSVMTAALLMAQAGSHEGVNPPRKDEGQKSASKVKELQKERIATLKAVTDRLVQQYQSGRVESDQVLEAWIQLSHAELDAAEKESDRITLYKNLADALKKFEERAEQKLKSGEGSLLSVLKIKARRLEAEIHLEQAKARVPVLEQRKIGVTSPRAMNVIITEQYVGRLRAQRHIKVCALVGGYLEAVPVKEGQAVKKGDVLFKVNPILYKARWDAKLAQQKFAELELKDVEKLVKDNVASQNAAALLKAKLDKAVAEANLAEAENNFTVVRAPFDGAIGRLDLQQGSLVKEGDVLTTLSDNSAMWVYFNVPEARYLEYMADQAKDKEGKIELVLANGSKFKQTVKIGAILSRVSIENGNITFRADFPNPDGLLRQGMTGTVLIHRKLHNAIVIPQRAAFEILDKRYVFVVDKEGVAHQRAIVVQHELPGVFVIGRGVDADDRIVFEGMPQVRDGEKIEYEFRPPDQVPNR